MAKRQITPAQEQQVLGDLSQTSSAWLVGRKASWFRDNPAIPRNANGNYDAQAVVAWLVQHPDDVNIGDDLYERILRAAELVNLAIGDGGESVRRLFVELRDQFGGDGMALFSETLLGVLAVNPAPALKESEIENEIDKEYIIQRRLARRRFFHDTLQAAVICESCGRVRCGRKWSKPTEKYPSDSCTADICPRCASKRTIGDGEL